MRREQLEHLLRAASQVTEERDLLVIGSQAILGSFTEDQLPSEAIRSMEADIAVFDDPADRKADKIDGAIGAPVVIDRSPPSLRDGCLSLQACGAASATISRT